jgi:hypothetical protein
MLKEDVNIGQAAFTKQLRADRGRLPDFVLSNARQ